MSADDRAQLADGVQLADSLAAAERWDDAGVVALAYFERLRLGLGSPFRLAEQAAGDSRLPTPLARRVAWGLLARTLRGEAFAVDSAALGDAPTALRAGGVTDGGWHRVTIDSVVRAGPSARTGEEAVRVAYALARAERLVTARTAQAAVNAAALARDRRLAVADVERLLAASRAAPDTDALTRLAAWRADRRFWSETPLLADALTPDAAAAVASAERLLGAMRRAATAPRMVAPDSTNTLPTVVGNADSGGVASRAATMAASAAAPDTSAGAVATPAGPAAPQVSVARIGPTPAARRDDNTLGALPLAAARHLAALPSVRDVYPSAPIVVTLGGFRRAPVTDTLDVDTLGTDLGEGAAARVGARVRARLVARARTEELLAAEWAVARPQLLMGSAARRELGALVQAAAVALRPWAQAPARDEGLARGAGVGAEVDALRLRDGYRAVAFDAGTPLTWRVAAARQLAGAVGDLRSVFPYLTLDGLTVRVGESPRHELALALHDPVSRTVYLPPATGAGTVAHELAHDLDWQTGRSLLALRGVYGTDRLARGGGSTTLAHAVRALAPARALGTVRPAPNTSASSAGAHDGDRPAEQFARAADFFVAAALARDGRANGVLSAVQDGVLAGYAGVAAPEPGDGTAEALMGVLDTLTLVPPGTRAWFLGRFGAGGVRTPLAVMRPVLTAQSRWEGERALRFSGVPGGLVTEVTGAVSTVRDAGCAGVGGGTGAPWQARLVWLAADARARGSVRTRAVRAVTVGGAWWGWTARGILGGPWRADAASATVARLRDGLLRAGGAEARRASAACGLLDP